MSRRFYFLSTVLIVFAVLGFVLPTPLFGVFEVTPLLNAVHLGAGVVTALAARRGLGTMRNWGRLLGYLFAALTVAAVMIDGDAVADLLPLSDANAWLHLGVTMVFLYHALLAPPS
jgi:hypothetical protein